MAKESFPEKIEAVPFFSERIDGCKVEAQSDIYVRPLMMVGSKRIGDFSSARWPPIYYHLLLAVLVMFVIFKLPYL